MSKGKIDHLIVTRLHRLYPWPESLYRNLRVRKLLRYDPIAKFTNENIRPDDEAWHFGRVRFFYDLFCAGKRVDPIVVDNVCEGMLIYAQPILIDGHHRFTGARLARVRTIPTYYSGRVDLLNYLTGKTRKAPVD